MIYAKSLGELTWMLEKLFDELQKCGLQINPTKCKIMALQSDDVPTYVDVNGNFIAVLCKTETLKYLDWKIPGDALNRSNVELSNRFQCAWFKYHKQRNILTDKHVSIASRLKLFQSVISPTVLFGLGQIPLTRHHLSQLDILQNRMIRNILG